MPTHLPPIAQWRPRARLLLLRPFLISDLHIISPSSFRTADFLSGDGVTSDDEPFGGRGEEEGGGLPLLG